jgi:hypothetical protein
VGKNLPTARDERVNVRVEELDGGDEVTIGRGTGPDAAADGDRGDGAATRRTGRERA